MKQTPIPLEEIRKSRLPVRNVNLEHKENLSSLDNFAIWITSHIGTMGFFFIVVAWTAGWVLWNVFAPKEFQFDPYPAFVLWLFVSNMIQIILMPLIVIGQNLQGRHAEFRAQADFEVNTKAEREIENILIHLEYQEDVLEEIRKKVGA